MLTIEAVSADSIGAELDLEPGDRLVAINGNPVEDQIDYQLYSQGEQLVLEVQKCAGELWEIELERDADDPVGLEFADPVPRQCVNNCQFCFVRQLPRGLRPSLYVRDDDYRFSYLYGAYITLTNLSDSDVDRIISQQLSPLYVSVHAVDAAVRAELMGRRDADVMPLLKRLLDGGIKLHTQVVLCPGKNDGACLDETITTLAALYPQVLSLAVVPVGLTAHRQALPPLQLFEREQARQVLDQIHGWQQSCRRCCGDNFVYAADELYLRAGADLPPLEEYGRLELLENGVGLVALFRHQGAEVLDSACDYPDIRATLVTGESAAAQLEEFAARLNRRSGCRLRVQAVRNSFFGPSVTVAGLLAGEDIIAQLHRHCSGEAILLPDVVCREGDDVLLDGVRLADIAARLNAPVIKVAATPWGIVDGIEQIMDEMEGTLTWPG